MRRHAQLSHLAAGFLFLLGAVVGPLRARAVETADLDPIYLSLSGGAIDFEGDEPVKDAALAVIRAGYDYSETWSFELGLEVIPRLKESWRRDWRTGEPISRLEEAAGPGVHDTSSLRLMFDGLQHFTRWEKLDPYLAFGVGLAWYADTIDDTLEPLVEAGAGCMYHLSDEWGLRADFRTLIAGSDTEANSTYTLGVRWTPGARLPPPLPPAVQPSGQPLDSDRDGLPDTEETERHHTDPLNKDTDWDALTDGDELRKHGTDPLKRDTDGGAVYDGHEVIEDQTDPKLAADDLRFFELRLMFDPGDWRIKSEYYSEIGVIGKILKDDPSAVARIEGHSDQPAGVTARGALKLTTRRAQAVADYLAANWGIETGRLTPVGYGLTRPKGPNDPVKGNRDNERIEVYIRHGAR